MSRYGSSFSVTSKNVASSPALRFLPLPILSKLQWASGSISLFLGLSSLILLSVWFREFEGGFDTGVGRFNLHPLSMIFAFPFFLTHGILAWRLYPLKSHAALKTIHVISNLCAAAFIGLGLWSTLTVHVSHFVSFHSWVGICTAGIFVFQLLGGLIFYAIPGIPIEWKISSLPVHAWLGTLTYIAGMLTVASGLTNYLGLNAKQIRFNSREMFIGNSVGIIVFATLIFALYAVLPSRKPELEAEEGEAAGESGPGGIGASAYQRYGTAT